MQWSISRLMCLSLLAVGASSTAYTAELYAQQKAVAKEVDSPDGTSTSANFSPKALVEASTDKTTATLTLAKQFLAFSADTAMNFGLTVKTPFDSSKDDVKDLGSISGLTAGTNARLDLGGLYWPRPSEPSLQELDSVCNKYIQRILPGYHWSTDPKVLNTEDLGASEHNLAKITEGASCFVLLTPDGLKGALKVLNDAAAAQAKLANQPAPAAIAPIAGSDDVLAEGFQKLRKANQETLQNAHSLTLSLTANRQKFSFASMAAPTQLTHEDKTGKGASLTYSFIRSSSVLGIGASYEKSFAGGKDVQICSPIGSTGSTQCTNGALKAPTENADELVFIEYRSVFGSGGGVAISPRVEYKTNTSDVGVKLPIYLARNDKRILDGGLALGWTKTDHFAASVFVGKAFSFFD